MSDRFVEKWECCVCGNLNDADMANCGCGHYYCEDCETVRYEVIKDA